MTPLRFLFVAAFYWLVSSNLIGANIAWDGGGIDQFWNTKENWSTDTIPGSSDQVTLPGGSGIVEVPTASVADIDVEAGSGIKVSGNLTLGSASVIRGLSFGSTGARTVTSQGQTEILGTANDGTGGVLAGSGDYLLIGELTAPTRGITADFTVQAGAKLKSQSVNSQASNLIVEGELVIGDPDVPSLPAAFNNSTNPNVVTLQEDGLLTVVDNGTPDMGGVFIMKDSAKIMVEAGEFNFAPGIATFSGGTVEVANEAQMIFKSSTGSASQRKFNGIIAISGLGSARFETGYTFSGSVEFSLSGGKGFEPNDLLFEEGLLSNSGIASFSGGHVAQPAMLGASGSIENNSGATLSVDAPSGYQFNVFFENRGTTSVNAPLVVGRGFANVSNMTFTDSSSVSEFPGATTGAIINRPSGTLVFNDSNGGTKNISVPMQNEGTLNVEKGNVVLKKGGAFRQKGTTTIAENASLVFEADAITFGIISGGHTFNGAGSLFIGGFFSGLDPALEVASDQVVFDVNTFFRRGAMRIFEVPIDPVGTSFYENRKRFDWQGGTIGSPDSSTSLTLFDNTRGGVLNITTGSAASNNLYGILFNNSQVNQNTSILLDYAGDIFNNSEWRFTGPCTLAEGLNTSDATFTNDGSIVLETTSSVNINITLSNGPTGKVFANQGMLNIARSSNFNFGVLSGGEWSEGANSQGSIQYPGNITEVRDATKVTDNGGDNQFRNLNEVGPGVSASEPTDVLFRENQEFVTNLKIRENARLRSEAGVTAPSFTVEGELGGSGTIQGETSLLGSLRPGFSIGAITFNDPLTMSDDPTVEIEIDATSTDTVTVNDTLTLDGYIKPVLLDGFDPVDGAQFTVMTASNLTGTFDGVDLSGLGGSTQTFTVSYPNNTVVLTAGTTMFTTFLEYQQAAFSPEEQLDPEVSGLNIDAEGDGLTNFQEYFHGRLARVADNQNIFELKELSNSGGNIVIELTFPRAKGITDATYEVRATASLEESFSSIPYVETSSEDRGDYDQVTTQVTLISPAPNRQFFQLVLIYTGL